MKKYILLLLLLLLIIPNNLWGACSWSDNTGTAASASVSDIGDCVTDSSSKTGEVIINLPNASATWTGNLTINMSSGFTNVTSLSIIGAGSIPTGTTTGAASSGGTTITLSSTQVDFTGSSAKKFRIANITWAGTANSNNGAIQFKGLSKPSTGGGWRVDHMTFNNAPTRAVTVAGYTYGVIDHCYRTGAGQVFNVSESTPGVAYTANTAWGRSVVFDGNDAVYFEDNDIECTGTCSSPIMFCDVTDGGKVVIRHNKIQNHYIGGHDASSVNRGVMMISSYNNEIILSQISGVGSHGLRGGTGVHFNNYVSSEYTQTTALYAAERPHGFSMHNYRSEDAGSVGLWTNACNTSSDALKGYLGINAVTYSDNPCTTGTGCEYIDDKDGDGKGYPCRDQVGREADQALKPMLFWSNRIKFSTDAAILVTPHVYSGAQTDIQANRDYYSQGASFDGSSGIGCGTILPGTCTTGVYYWFTSQSCSDLTGLYGIGTTDSSGTLYKCTSTNTWTAYYTPYTYPHPLRGESDATAPTNTQTGNSINAAGTSLTLNYSETLVKTGDGTVSLTCSGGAVTPTYASGSGTANHVYTLNRTVNQGEVCTVSYTQGGNDLEDTAGNDLATYSDHTIVNGSTQQTETTYNFTITVVGNGTINSSQGGIQCHQGNTPCVKSCDSGTVLTLTATPDNGWGTGTISGTNCGTTTTMSAARTCTVTFPEIHLFN